MKRSTSKIGKPKTRKPVRRPAQHRLVLTGTPLENSVLDLWSIFDFLMPGYLGTPRIFANVTNYPSRDSAPSATTALAPLAPLPAAPIETRRGRRSARQDRTGSFAPNSHQRAAYDAQVSEIQQGLGSSGSRARRPAKRMMVLTGLLRLRQVCCDLRLVGIDKEATSAKLDLSTNCLRKRSRRTSRPRLQPVRLDAALVRERLEEDIEFCYLDGTTKQRRSRGTLPEDLRPCFPDQPQSRRRGPESDGGRHRHSFRSVVESRGRRPGHRSRASHRPKQGRDRLQTDHPRHRRGKNPAAAGEETAGD